MTAILIGLAAALGAAELLARLVVDDPRLFDRLDRWVDHPQLGRVPRPNHTFTSHGVRYSTNSLGLRDVERSPRTADGVTRILIVGDSFVFGVGAAETIFPAVVEEVLHAAGRTDMEVVPVGLPGYGTAQQNVFLHESLAGFEFDHLVLAFCVGNDLTENRRFEMGKLPESRQRKDSWLANSRIYQLARRGKRALAKAGHARFHEHVRKRMRLARPETWEQEDWRAAHASTLSEIGTMRAFAQARGAGFSVCLLPDEYQFDAALRQAAYDRVGDTPDGVRLRLVQERLTPELGRRGIPVVDPYDRFATEYEPGRFYIPFDTHFSEAGNRLAGAAIAEHLQEVLPRTARAEGD